MIKILKYRNVLLCGIFPDFVQEKVSIEEYKKARGLYIEDPWERVKCIFKKNQYGESHPEFKHAEQMLYAGLCIGACYGGLKNALEKSENFIRTNESTIFQNKRAALSAYVNHNTLSFVKGAFRWAPIFGFFLSGFSLVSSCSEAYRNKPSIFDSFLAGAIIGGTCRFMFGIKGMISGASVGGVLGGIYGVMLWGLTKISNSDQIELKYAQFAFMNYREQAFNHMKAEKTKEDEYIEKTGLHVPHVVNPLNQLDSSHPVDSNKEETNR